MEEDEISRAMLKAMLMSSAESFSRAADSITIPSPPERGIDVNYLNLLISLNASKLSPLIQAYSMASAAESEGRDKYREKAHVCMDCVFDSVDSLHTINRKALQ